ncbi:MAG TPA: phosphate acyltransferase PlsX [Candidatus Acidoferrum sp.]|nr:phosphate acyltransferase PlsX [Candidatus Acidoferrum sp.]
MKIILDACGGDNAPEAMVAGACDAAKKYKIEVILCGPERDLKTRLKKYGAPAAVTVVPAALPGDFGLDYLAAVRARKPVGITVGMKLLSDGGGDAFVSCGSTGAVMIGAVAFVGRVPGARRVALGTPIPKKEGFVLLLDSGAGLECAPETFVEFANHGVNFMKSVTGIEHPVVGLINNGREEDKGRPEYVEAHRLLRESGLNFYGNLETRDLFTSPCDVAVCDGFVGNAILKTVEGVAQFFSSGIKEAFMKNTLTKLGGLLAKSGISDFKRRFDYTEFGGVPIIGAAKPVIKAHGSSNARSVTSAIRQAVMAASGSGMLTMETGKDF